MSRCLHSGSRGQCCNHAVDGSEYCAKHANEKDRIEGYYLNNPKLQARLGHHNDEKSIRTVQQEVVLLRGLIENRLNLANSPSEEEAAFNAVQPAIANVNRLIDNLMKLELRTSQVLTKDTLDVVRESIVDILIEELNEVPNRDPIIDRISTRIAEAIKNARNANAE